MIQQVSDLLGTVQSVLQGKLPITLIHPVTLQNMLRNISLNLPPGYDLIAGITADNIYSCYELTTVTSIGNTHGINLIINVPLKTASQHFALYKIIVLLARTSGNNFDTQLNFHISALMTVTVSTSYLRKRTEDVALRLVSSCARQMWRFILNKL
jgi:hypothetical protein